LNNQNNNMKRILIDIIIFISIVVLPWWLSVVVLVVFIIYERHPYEVLFFGLFIDSLYGIPQERFLSFGWATLLAVAVFCLSFFVKERLLFYNK